MTKTATESKRKVYGPASDLQRIVLQDKLTDVILVGGGR